MASVGWCLLAALLAASLAGAKCESTAFPVIPRQLLECYKNEGMYHRENRIPSTLHFFLDLLKKVEQGPTSKNMDARSLSLALVQYLKLDGVHLTQAEGTYSTGNVLPFAPSGGEYFKHRLTLIGLLPRIDQGYMAAINETLTQKEMCDLHFMLSYSVDPYKRRDEKCTPLFEDFRRTDSEERRGWSVSEYYKRHRRHIDHSDGVKGMKGGRRRMGVVGAPAKQSHGSFGKVERSRRSSEKDRNLEVEEIPIVGKTQKGHEEKDKFTIGTQELLSDEERHRQAGLQSLVQMRHLGRFGGRMFGLPGHFTEESPITGIIPGIPLSDCPLVNGVIVTPFGSLTIGNVILGIAAGLNPEEIPPTRLSVDPTELESHSDRVKNIWATTLSGTVADALSSPALMSADSVKILKGGWNDTSNPKWYLLSSSDFMQLPEVTLRGSLDGYLLGANAKRLTDKFPGFKLSQLLETFYRYSWGEVGAKNRVQLMAKYVADEDFRKQTHLMSLVMKKQKTQVLTVLDYRPIVAGTVSRVVQHLKTMDGREKSYIGSFLSSNIDISTSLVAVIDSSWERDNLFRIFRVLSEAQVAGGGGNNLTIVCGRDGKILLSSDNSVVINNQFTKEMLMQNCSRGMDLPLVFDRLDARYRKVFYDEKMSGKMITASQVVVLFPFEPVFHNIDYVTEKSRTFGRNFPSIRLMVAAVGSVDSYRPLVKDPKDVFSIVLPSTDSELKSAKAFAAGVKRSFHRLSRPSCGSYFDDETQGGEVQVTRDVYPGYVSHYRLLPQYFYTQHGKVTITVISKQRAPLTVCHSREVDGPTPRGDLGNDYKPDDITYRPDFPPEASPYGRQTNGEENGRVTCNTITSEAYKIEMENPCEGASNLQECRPLYISLSAPLQDTISIICPNCRLPLNVQYQISLNGLTCYNSAAVKLLSPVLFCFLLVRYFFL